MKFYIIYSIYKLIEFLHVQAQIVTKTYTKIYQ